MLRRAGLLSLMLLVLSYGFSVAATDKKSAPNEDYYEMFKILADTMDQVERNYVKPVDRRELVEAAIQGMLGKLDPHSTYIGPQEISQFRASVENEFGGIGIQIGLDGGQLRVLSPLYGTPAYRAGLMPGDRIVEIEGESTEGISLDKAMQGLRGAPGSKVTITVVHPGSSDTEKITITREVVHVETVLGHHRLPDDHWDYMLDSDKHIGYVRLTAFSRDTARELRQALEELRGAKMRALVLDLRFNPGGLLNAAIEISGFFMSKGRIVSTSGRNSPSRAWDARPGDTFEGFPMVILVNRFSASASEIVSACLQDNKRAIVVGERTWGKGSVQNVIELEDGHSMLKLTTASYLRPSGKNIHRFPGAKEDDEWGVRPDKGYELKLDDRELIGLIEDRRNRDILHPHVRPAGDSKKADKSTAQTSARPSDKTIAKPDVPSPVKTTAKPAMPAAAKPAAGKPATAKATKPADKAKPAAASPKFVDRQLQMALDYMTAEFAKAGK